MTYHRDYNAPHYAEKAPAISPRTTGINTFAVGVGIVALLAIAVFAFASVGNNPTTAEGPAITITPQDGTANTNDTQAIPATPDATAGQQG